ncbi:Cell cycle checkpoint protein rad17 [Nowakowskiella sp. JEL0078]|nr:Cell cycle checkpoint protein rad17 [Nowakowskiella sp. JEL0078]
MNQNKYVVDSETSSEETSNEIKSQLAVNTRKSKASSKSPISRKPVKRGRTNLSFLIPESILAEPSKRKPLKKFSISISKVNSEKSTTARSDENEIIDEIVDSDSEEEQIKSLKIQLPRSKKSSEKSGNKSYNLQTKITDSKLTKLTNWSFPVEKEMNVEKESRDDLWVDKYKPTSENELAIHRKKLQEVKTWLISAFSSGNKKDKLLVLTGPTGSGKTAVIEVLSKELNFEVVQWINPMIMKE